MTMEKVRAREGGVMLSEQNTVPSRTEHLVKWFDPEIGCTRISRIGDPCPECGIAGLDVFVAPGDCDLGFGCNCCGWIGGSVRKYPCGQAEE